LRVRSSAGGEQEFTVGSVAIFQVHKFSSELGRGGEKIGGLGRV
jgi:hypothetical protein